MKFYVTVYSNGFKSPMLESLEEAKARLIGSADLAGTVLELDVTRVHNVVPLPSLNSRVLYKPLGLELVVSNITGDIITAVTPGDYTGEATQYTDVVDNFERVG